MAGLTPLTNMEDANNGSSPKYQMLASILKSAILSADGSPVKLPSYRSLMKEYNVSLSTVRQAFDMLKAEGLITSHQGRGTFAQPNRSPRSVSLANRLNIVLPNADINNPATNPRNWFMTRDMMQGIAEKAQASGLAANIVTLEGCDGNPELIPDSKVYVFLDPTDQQARIKKLENNGITCICINPIRRYSPFDVMVETEYGTYQAVKALVAHGKQRVAFLRADLDAEYFRERVRGFRLALADSGLPYLSELVRECDGSIESGYTAMQQLLQMQMPPDAVFAITDLRALGAMQAIKEWGMRIPEDISIVGFDNIPESLTTSPPLATVSFPRREAGHSAVEIACRVLSGEQNIVPVTLQAEYIERASAGGK